MDSWTAGNVAGFGYRVMPVQRPLVSNYRKYRKVLLIVPYDIIVAWVAKPSFAYAS